MNSKNIIDMRYALTIKGKVQNAGYRKLIEKKAKDRGLKGYVFNDADGTVKLVCEGAADRIDDFIEVIDLHEENIFVENILKNEVAPNYPIPGVFGRIETDTPEDILRKIEKGLDTLGGIKGDTGALSEGQGKMLLILESNHELTKSNREDQKTVIKLLEKIAEK
jgi:acylphosphatase